MSDLKSQSFNHIPLPKIVADIFKVKKEKCRLAWHDTVSKAKGKEDWLPISCKNLLKSHAYSLSRQNPATIYWVEYK